MTEEDYQRMLKAQNGGCAICGKDEELHVDHCHDTSMVRGLLCRECNMDIGKLGHDVEPPTARDNLLMLQQIIAFLSCMSPPLCHRRFTASEIMED